VAAELGPPGDGRGLRTPRHRRPNDPLIVRRGLYQEQLERWFGHIPRHRFLILQSERLFEDPLSEMRRVWGFLGLPEQPQLGRVMRNRNKPHEPYDPAVLERLRAFYRPHNERLAEFLGMDLAWT
jgi:hypothetical protein